METERPQATITEYLTELEDPRRYNRRHKLLDILVIAICATIDGADGKALRRSHDRSLGKKALYMVSAWASDNGLVLGQERLELRRVTEIASYPPLWYHKLVYKGGWEKASLCWRFSLSSHVLRDSAPLECW